MFEFQYEYLFPLSSPNAAEKDKKGVCVCEITETDRKLMFCRDVDPLLFIIPTYVKSVYKYTKLNDQITLSQIMCQSC